MSTEDIQSRLRSLFDANKGITTLTTKLAKLSGDASLSSSTASLANSTSSQSTSQPDSRAELSAEIHQSLKDLEEEYEALRQDAEEYLGSSSTSTFSSSLSGANSSGSSRRRNDPQREQTRLALATQIERLGEDIRASRALFRKAQLQAKRNEEAARRAERSALFAGANSAADPEQTAPNPSLRRKHSSAPKASGDELLVHAAGDVTLALRRTHALMQAELKRSEFAHETLQRSTAALQDLGSSYGSLGDVLGRSRSLIRTLSTSQKSDTWYLETALAILLATLAWLVFRRVAYYPLYYLAFAPLRASLRLVAAVVNVVVGVFVGAGSKGRSGVGNLETTGSTSLKIKPSATGRGAARVEGMPAPSMHVGGGGKDRVPEEKGGAGPLSEEIGEMAEASQERQKEGTVLRERRPDEPVNPKKRMMEAPPPEAKDEGRKDEL